MKIKWGALVVDGRNKIGGQVASKNRAGAYMRNKVTPVNPQTAAQQLVRNGLASLSQNWRGLTQAQRDAWNSAVSDFATTDIFGDIRNPTGKNLYVKLNANLQSVGEAIISAPPALGAVAAVVAGTLTISLAIPTYTVAFTGTDATVGIQVWATPSLSPGVSFVKSEYRQIGIIDGAAITPADIEAMYLAKYGAATLGQKMFVKLVSVVKLTGQKSTGSQAQTIVVA